MALNAERLLAHCAARALQLGHLLARAHGRAAAWYAGVDRLGAEAAQRAAIDATHEGHVACLTARQEWLDAFAVAALEDAAAACMGAAECVDVHTAWARTETDPAAATLMLAKADEAARALRAADAPAPLDLFKTSETPDAA